MKRPEVSRRGRSGSKRLILVCALAPALLTKTASGQDVKKPGAVAQETKSYQAPISCTANVPATLCKNATREFGAIQQVSKVMEQVEIVIADEVSFKRENDRLASRHRHAMQIAAQGNDSAIFFGLMSRGPTAPSGLEGSVLFVLEDDGLRKINKVIVSSELLRAPSSTEKSLSVGGNSRFEPPDYDADLIYMWSKYIAGYAEGWFWGRTTQLSEESTAPPK